VELKPSGKCRRRGEPDLGVAVATRFPLSSPAGSGVSPNLRTMPAFEQEQAKQICAGERRAIARAITEIESGGEAGICLLKLLFHRAGRAFVVGVTGSPGTGKSTLVERLALEYRAAGVRVGIIAVDPTSPFSGGALLGDRIRMQRLAFDEGAFIRSMATRGHLGGLAPATHDVVTVLDAAGFDVIFIETVGVGQDEVEIARLADATALLLVPGQGDDVQMFKAGVMEIADLFVINKSDFPGAERVEQELNALLAVAQHDQGWCPPILKTVATTGEGIGELRESLERFRSFQAQDDLKMKRQYDHWRARLMELLRRRLLETVVASRLNDGSIDRLVEDILARRQDPYSAVEQLIEESIPARAPSTRGAR
jgi:LAO/AO transport system kinase